MKRTKIAIVIEVFGNGGVSKVLKDFLIIISKYVCEITLFIRDYDNSILQDIPSNVTYKRFPQKKGFFQYLKTRGLICSLEYLYNRFVARFFFWNYQKQTICSARCYDILPGEYDCVIGYHMAVNAVTVMALEKTSAKKKVLWLHGKKTFHKKNMRMFSLLYKKADAIVAVSKDTEERLVRLFPELTCKATTIHNFYDFDLILQKASEPIEPLKKNNEAIIVSTGRLSQEKGFDRVPEVAKKLVDDGYNIKWYIVGDGNKRESISASIQEKGLEKNVILLGYIDNPFPYVKNCDIYVQPSYTEGFCTSTMEAKILKRPVVTTDVPGMNEQFTNGHDGLIVESSIDGLYCGIKRLLDDQQLYEDIIQRLNEKKLTNDEEVQKALRVITV